jgi:predicted RNA polymerase sigma factor
MAQRISRAKKQIRQSGDPFRMPSGADRDQRLRTVLHVLYLIFNEGYTGTRGEQLQRVDLSCEAIRLARLLADSSAEEPEVMGLLALMLLLDARRPARTDGEGRLVPLPDQDRSLWDQSLVEEGLDLLRRAMMHRDVGEYQLQAAIAAVHDRAPSADATDWGEICALYELLEGVTGNPVVTLNRAVAVAIADGPEGGLRLVDSVADRLGNTQRWLGVRGHLLTMAGDTDGAADHLQRAAALSVNAAEQRHLLAEVARLRHTGAP